MPTPLCPIEEFGEPRFTLVLSIIHIPSGKEYTEDLPVPRDILQGYIGGYACHEIEAAQVDAWIDTHPKEAKAITDGFLAKMPFLKSIPGIEG